MNEKACKQCECSDCDCECHYYNYNIALPGHHRLWKKKEQIQHLSDAITDLIQQEGLTNMEAIEALSLIITGLVSYEITERPNDKKIIIDEYEESLKRRLLGIALSRLDLKPFVLHHEYSDEIKNDNK